MGDIMFGLTIILAVMSLLLAGFMVPLAYNLGLYLQMTGFALLPVVAVGLIWLVSWLAKKNPEWKFM